VLLFKAAQRGDLCWWADPIFWIGVLAIASGAAIFFWLLVPPWVVDRSARRSRREAAIREGHANQLRGLEEIINELGQISGQLKQELRWGQRGPLFPNTAWTKNQHLVTVSDVRAAVDSAYAQAHELDLETRTASQSELDPGEVQKRQRAKRRLIRPEVLLPLCAPSLNRTERNSRRGVGRHVSHASPDLADLLRELDDDSLGAADVAEPVAVLVAHQLADEFNAAGSQTGNDGVDVLDDECEVAYPACSPARGRCRPGLKASGTSPARVAHCRPGFASSQSPPVRPRAQ
jgi:hypothetical protein